MGWLGFAFLSAVMAALTSILAKIGIKGVDSNVATAVRTIVILAFAWGIILINGSFRELGSISAYSLTFLILSGIATGLSWLFYFRALSLGSASQVAPVDKLSLVLTIILAAVILRERVTVQILAGGLLMTAGAIVIALAK